MSVIVLPPAAGDLAVDSDTEQVPDVMDNNEMFDTAGELEVEVEGEDSDDEGENSNSEDDVPPPSKKQKKKGKGQGKQLLPKWTKSAKFSKEISIETMPNITDNFPMLTTLSPFALWSLIFDHKMITEIVKQSNLYANRDKNDKQFSVTNEEVSKLLGIILLSGYHSLPRESDYWSTQQDLGVPIVSECMSSKRYQTIKRFVHLADNEQLQAGDKTGKIAPLITAMNENLVQFGVFQQNLSIDESMTPYFGRHSMKMFIRGKPIRFGFKWWCLCGTDGYPYNLKLYSGREVETVSKQPLGSRVVYHMVDVIKQHSETKYHHLFFDNFFTSHALVSSLTEDSLAATGTIREVRTGGANNVLVNSKDMKKKGKRGDFDYCSDGTVYVVKWYDNSLVSVASNNLTHEPVQTANRRVKGSSNVAVNQPFLIRQYNEGMGGVDLMDRLLASYRPCIRGKKWWWPLFTNLINVSVIAAWRIYCNVHGTDMDHLSFRRDITLCLLKGAAPSTSSVHSRQVAHLPTEVRQSQELKHERTTCSQGRCRLCMKNTTIMCSVCKVRLHTDKGKTCFVDYHDQ